MSINKSLLLCVLFFTGICLLNAQPPLLKDPGLVSTYTGDTSFLINKRMKETHIFYLNKNQKPVAVHVIEAKLKRNRLALKTSTPFDKDTFAMQTVQQQIKQRKRPNEKVLAGINADFFNMQTGEPVSMSIHDGKTLKDTLITDRGFVGVKRNGKVIIGDARKYLQKKKRLTEVLGGAQLLVENGHILPQANSGFSTIRHPRTALGIVSKRKVIFVVVDGRQPEYSNGMPLHELAVLMKSLGARTAINLDGGGSSTLISADGHGDWKVRNKPSGGIQRNVANAWVLVAQH